MHQALEDDPRHEDAKDEGISRKKEDMRKKKSAKLNMLAAALVLSLCCTAKPNLAAETEKTQIASAQKTIDANQAAIDALKEEQAKVNDTISGLKDQKADTASYIKALDQSMTELTNEVNELNASIAQKQLDIQFTQGQLAEAAQTESDQYASMKLRIRFMYEKGDTSFIDMILNAESWADLLNKAEYIAKITEYDRQKLDEFAATKQFITNTNLQLEAEQAQLVTMQASASAKQQSVATLLAQKNQELAAYNQKIRSAQSTANQQQGEINALYADIEEQESTIAAMEKEIKRQEEEARKKAEAEAKAKEEAARKAAVAAGKDPDSVEKVKSDYTTRTMSGGFTWPVPSGGRISSTFGSREAPTEGASTYHKGIDIAASSGSKVVAAAGGEVVIATYSASAGNYVMINHGSGVYTVYMHMANLGVSEGQEVKQGESIGSVGSTGYSTGPHLHFGIRENGSYVDPQNFM